MNPVEHLPMVRYLATRLVTRLPANVERDDLIQAGSIGLMDAADRFDETQGEFAAFASPRIQGAMLDELRGSDSVSRHVRARNRAVGAAETRLQQRLGRQPTHGEIAAEAGVPLDQYHREAGGYVTVSLEDAPEADAEVDDGDPADHAQHAQRVAALVAQIACLPDRERHVVRMHHEHDLSFTDIAATLGVTPTRVGQVYGAALARLRLRLSAY